jgi:hypothetical protein
MPEADADQYNFAGKEPDYAKQRVSHPSQNRFEFYQHHFTSTFYSTAFKCYMFRFFQLMDFKYVGSMCRWCTMIGPTLN